MDARSFISSLKKIDIDFFCGVPDSLLKGLNYELENDLTIKNIVTANEGSAIALSAGYFLSKRKPACVYLQNSGLGNTINPLVSLMSEAVYNIPLLMIIGWRGEPGIKDEPQHNFQGQITVDMLNIIGVKVIEISNEMSIEAVNEKIIIAHEHLKKMEKVALLIRKNALTFNDEKLHHENHFSLSREFAIETILSNIDLSAPIVSTTGKSSRELYEICYKKNLNPNRAFLTVGSMGYASMIALGIVMNFKKRTYCLDGDGAVLMHMGSLATIGEICPNNLVHILINNSAHESVGGMKTTNTQIDFSRMASVCGYKKVFYADSEDSLIAALKDSENESELCFIEVKVSNYSREDLIRPKESPQENKRKFMEVLK